MRAAAYPVACSAALPALACLAALPTLAGCSDNFGEPCGLPKVVEQNCRSDSDESLTNCVMTDALDCDSKLCAVFQNSAPFCSQDCATDGDCPGGSSCQSFFLDEAQKFCVPSDLIRSQDNAGGGGGGGGSQAEGEGEGAAEGEGEGEGGVQ